MNSLDAPVAGKRPRDEPETTQTSTRSSRRNKRDCREAGADPSLQQQDGQAETATTAALLLPNDTPPLFQPSQQELDEAVGSRNRQRNLQTWYQRLNGLYAFRQAHGHCRVPHSYSSQLSDWVAKQRKWKKKRDNNERHFMTDTRLQLLEALGFEWTVQNQDHKATWTERYQELVEFHKQHGHFRVPTKTLLGRWVKHQRGDYRKRLAKEQSPMTTERVQLLDAIHFPWAVTQHPEIGWDEQYRRLVEFQQQHHHLRVPSKSQLGSWVRRQRRMYKRRQSTGQAPLTEEQIHRLESIGFSWDSDRFQKSWSEYYAELVAFQKQHGHLNVPSKTMLGGWIERQRYEYRRLAANEPRSLSTERAQQLEAIGFSWSEETENRSSEANSAKAKSVVTV